MDIKALWGTFFSKKNVLVKETFIYTATDMVGKAMSFILLPIVSFYMPPDELGLATNFTVLTNLIVLLAGLALVNSLPYFYYEQKREEVVLMVSNLLLLCFSLCILIVGLISVFSGLVEKFLQLDLQIQLISIFFVLGSLVTQTNFLLLRLENKAKSFAFIQIFQIVLHAAVVVLFVIVLRQGGIGKIYAEVLVYVIMGLFSFILLAKRGYLRLHLDINWMKKLLKYGIPLLPHSISFWLKGGVDKVFITTYCGLASNGLYSMALSISSLYTMLVNSFFNAYTPYLQKRLTQVEEINESIEKKKIVKQTYLLLLLFFIVGVLAVGGAWIIINFLIDKKYLDSFSYIPLIILANFIYTFYTFTIQYIYKAKKTLVMGIITFTGSAIQMLLSYWFIRLFGVMGAAYSLLVGNTLITIGISWYSNYVYPMPWLSDRFLTRKK